MTYSEKLKDPRWLEFKAEYVDHYRREHKGVVRCEQCGEEWPHYHLRHRRYEEGKDPWDYRFDAMRLMCEECHEALHALEKLARAWILTLTGEGVYQFDAFMQVVLSFPPAEQCHTVAMGKAALYEYQHDYLVQKEARGRWEAGIRTPV